MQNKEIRLLNKMKAYAKKIFLFLSLHEGLREIFNGI